MKLDLASLKNRTAWDAAGVKLPEFDIPAVIENTKATPTWVHFGAGNIFRGYVANLQNDLSVEEAIVTAGGVDVRQVSPKTMGSKLVENLYFAGEVLDVDGYTGGFNLQIAFSTGTLCGQNL